MNDSADQTLAVLEEMRDLLRLLAEPAIAERDKKLRASLREIVGNPGSKKAEAVPLMDGTRTQAEIVSQCGITKGNLSTFVKSLRESELLGGDPKLPNLIIPIPPNFFESGDDE